MKDTSTSAGLRQSLLDALNEPIRSSHSSALRRRQALLAISLENSVIADALIKEAKSLLKAGNDKEADKIIRIVKKLVNNNQRYQNMVGSLLSRTD